MLTCTDHDLCLHGGESPGKTAAVHAPGPTTVEYLRNKEKLPRDSSGFGRDVEPRGRYVIERGPGTKVPEGYEAGTVTFQNPLHVDFGGGYDEPTNWKRRLSEQHGGKTGRELSDAVVAAGHDGIITHDKHGTAEIVDLTGLRPRESAAKPAAPSFTWRYQAQTPTGYEDRERVVEGPFYHGSRSRRLREGDTVRPGFKTNAWGDEGDRSTHVHFTTDLTAAGQYAEQAGGHVYEVEPTGTAGGGYNSGEYKSQHPLRVLRRVSPEEWSGGSREATLVEPDRPQETVAAHPAIPTNAHVDWPRELSKMRRGIHRGMRVALPPEVHDFVHERMQSPGRQARAIVEHLRSSGVGLHWSPDVKIATDFATGGQQAGDWNGPKKGETSVVLHAETPSPEHIATQGEIDEARAAGHNFEPFDGWIGGPLKEIPLSPKAPVKITGVTWYQGPRRRKVHGDVWVPESPLAGQPRNSRYDSASDLGEADLDKAKRT